MLPHPRPRKGRVCSANQNGAEAPSRQRSGEGRAGDRPSGVLSELTTAQPSTTVSGGGHGHLTDRRGRGHVVSPATHNLPNSPRGAPTPGPY